MWPLSYKNVEVPGRINIGIGKICYFILFIRGDSGWRGEKKGTSEMCAITGESDRLVWKLLF